MALKLDDALNRVAVLADQQLQALGKAATPEELEAVQRLEDIVEALARRVEQQTTDDVGVDVTKLKRPIILSANGDEDMWETIFANAQATMRPASPVFECTMCDDTGIEKYVNRRGQRVATGRVCRQCGDRPTDLIQVRLSTTGRIVQPHTVMLPSEIEELRQLAQDGPTPTIRSNARDVLRTIPVAAAPTTSDAIRRAEENMLRQGATDGMTMMVQISNGDMRRTRPGDVLTAHIRSWLHERRYDTSGRGRELIQAILDQEPRATGRSARPVARNPQAAAALQSFVDGRALDASLPDLECEPTCAEPERPPQGAPKQDWERRDIHYVKIGTSSDEHGVEIIRPGDALNDRIRDTLNRSLNSMRSSSARGRARGEHAHRTAMIVRILREDTNAPF